MTIPNAKTLLLLLLFIFKLISKKKYQMILELKIDLYFT